MEATQVWSEGSTWSIAGAGKLGPWTSWAEQVLELRQAGCILSGTFRKMGWGSARGLEGRRSRDAVRHQGRAVPLGGAGRPQVRGELGLSYGFCQATGRPG